ncbi:hypothetical protein [Pandoravirus japonicus]|uniref:Uncharacterized protein n=1 Tax=Pandoravirus japonicus TaxID=2823154 RepID=A0A811BPW5_9VIRU|nr:hypothetical protein [Pandoravirus japonicus]
MSRLARRGAGRATPGPVGRSSGLSVVVVVPFSPISLAHTQRTRAGEKCDDNNDTARSRMAEIGVCLVLIDWPTPCHRPTGRSTATNRPNPSAGQEGQ